MELQTYVDISQIVAAATVVGGTVFGLVQLYEYRQQRREAVETAPTETTAKD